MIDAAFMFWFFVLVFCFVASLVGWVKALRKGESFYQEAERWKHKYQVELASLAKRIEDDAKRIQH